MRLPGYVRLPGVAALLTRPPTVVVRHRRTVPGAMTAAGLALLAAIALAVHRVRQRA